MESLEQTGLPDELISFEKVFDVIAKDVLIQEKHMTAKTTPKTLTSMLYIAKVLQSGQILLASRGGLKVC